MKHSFRTCLFLIMVCLSVPGPVVVRANDVCTWTGGWDNTPDEATDQIVVVSNDLSWTAAMPDTVASWNQLLGYTNTVTFETGYSGFAVFSITGECVISNGNWTHLTNGSGEPATNKLDIEIGGDLIVGSNAIIDADGKGYAGGPGAGQVRSGGSYGGQGGFKTGARGPAYGSLTIPLDPGSGSAAGNHRGGGVIRLVVTGATTLDGALSADGDDFTLVQGCGSGGSISLATASLIGSGSIGADGGIGDPVGGLDVQSGGGGRIAVTLTGSSSFGAVSMHAHGGSYKQAGGGTLYTRTQSQAKSEGVLIIDNTALSVDGTDISSNVTDTTVGQIQIMTNGRFRVLEDMQLDVTHAWSNAGTFVALPNSVVTMNGGDDVTLIGTTTFRGLVVSNATKTLTIEAGQTLDVDEELIFMGSAVSNLVLRSSSPGNPWFLDLDAGAAQAIQHVDVQDSHADPGATVSALLSIDSGNNTNWVFTVAGLTNNWLGTLSTDWGAGANWSLGRPPIAGDVKIIIGSSSNNAILPSAQSFANLDITSGGALSLGTHDLTIAGDADVNGNMIAQARETLTFRGDVDFTDGAFNSATSTLYLAGSSTQTMIAAGNSFYTLIVTNKGRSVNFRDLIAAEMLHNDSVDLVIDGGMNITAFRTDGKSGASTQTFGASTTNTVRDLYLLGETGKHITLVSSSPGTPWILNLLRRPCVHHVHVTDSDASGGQAIYPYAAMDGGNNPNWIFGANVLLWHGSESSDFSASANWTPTVAPDATARVIIDGNYSNAPVIATPQSVLELQVGCSARAVLIVDQALSIGKDLTIYPYGQLIANDPIAVSNDFTVVASVDLGRSTNVTHDPNSDEGSVETNRIDITVGGNLALDEGSAINVDAKGYNDGPGEGGDRTGGSHGGQGGVNGPLGPTYGSVLAPTDPGSGGAGLAHRGGGVVILDVAGSSAINGSLSANGEDFQATFVGAGSGGSIFLRTATLLGSGSLSADGGNGDFADSSELQSGGGGRLSVVLTEGDSFGSIRMTAYGGAYERPAAGTIYRERAPEGAGRGTLIIGNGSQQTQARFTTIPGEIIYDVNELADVNIVVTNFAWMQVVTSMTVETLGVISPDERFDLGDATDTLTLDRFSVNGTLTTQFGTYATNDWNGFSTPPNARGEGSIFIAPQSGSILEFK